jgi:NAD(P)-dependent dehydrogenase (short-subunit alcohol dehydrogenase family)
LGFISWQKTLGIAKRTGMLGGHELHFTPHAINIMSTYQNSLVISGGASGIGAASVQQALGRNWLVACCDVVPVEKAPAFLLTDQVLYIQGDVRSAEAMAQFARQAMQFFSDRNGGVVPQLGVVACAGISRRGDPEQVKLMQDINVGGTVNLLNAFAKNLEQQGLFVGLSSIVAAEGIAVKGDEEYKLTKMEARRIATEQAALLHVRGFAVAPGAIDTPMTRHEAIFAMLLLGAAQVFGHPDHAHHAEITRLAGVPQGATPADILCGLLGPALTEADDFGRVRASMTKDPSLASLGKAYMLYTNLKGEDGQIRPRTGLIVRAVDVLTELDVVIGPEVVAGRMLDQLATGQVPEGGLLRAYSRNGQDRIRELLRSFAG